MRQPLALLAPPAGLAAGLAAVLAVGLAAATTATAAPMGSLPELSDRQVESYGKAEEKATAALRAGQNAKAARAFEQALRISEGDPGVWYNLACVRALMGKDSAALEALDGALTNGWKDADWPTKDEDLAALHGTKAFEAWLVRVRAKAEEPESWPKADAATLAGSEAEIEAGREAWSQQLNRLGPVLGGRERQRVRREIAAWEAESWDRIGSRRETSEGRAEAALAAIRAICGDEPVYISALAAGEVVRRTESFLAALSSSALAPEVRLIRAEARFAGASRTDESEGQLESRGAFEQELLRLAATLKDGPVLERALTGLVGLSWRDLPMARRYYDRLARVAEDFDAVRDVMKGGEASGVLYRIEGLPEFTATTLDGRSITPASLKGQVTLLDFWATWCGPCKREIPHMKEAYSRFKDQGFEIVGIALDEASALDQPAFEAWCEEKGVTWPQVFDGKGWTTYAEQFGVKGIPFPLLVGRDGSVVAATSQLRGEQLLDVVAEHVMEGKTPMAVGGN